MNHLLMPSRPGGRNSGHGQAPGWSVGPPASSKDPGKGHTRGCCGSLSTASAAVPILKVCGEEAFCGSHVSLQRPGHLCPKGPHFVTVDTCILTKIRALAAAVVQDAPVTH